MTIDVPYPGFRLPRFGLDPDEWHAVQRLRRASTSAASGVTERRQMPNIGMSAITAVQEKRRQLGLVYIILIQLFRNRM